MEEDVVLLVGFPEKPVQKQRFACREMTGECQKAQSPWWTEGSCREQWRNMGCNDITTEASADAWVPTALYPLRSGTGTEQCSTLGEPPPWGRDSAKTHFLAWDWRRNFTKKKKKKDLAASK